MRPFFNAVQIGLNDITTDTPVFPFRTRRQFILLNINFLHQTGSRCIQQTVQVFCFAAHGFHRIPFGIITVKQFTEGRRLSQRTAAPVLLYRLKGKVNRLFQLVDNHVRLPTALTDNCNASFQEEPQTG